jgi:hypothetical protein
MPKFFAFILLIFLFRGVNAQVEPIPKDFKTPKNGGDYKGLGGLDKKQHQAFNNISHPLSITGGILTLGGAALYVVGSEMNNDNSQPEIHTNNYQPQNVTQYIGIGTFFAGAVLFTIFSTERNKNAPKRKKVKEKYNAYEWEVQ